MSSSWSDDEENEFRDRWRRNQSWYNTTGRAKAYSDSANAYYHNILFKMAEAQKEEGFNEEDWLKKAGVNTKEFYTWMKTSGGASAPYTMQGGIHQTREAFETGECFKSMKQSSPGKHEDEIWLSCLGITTPITPRGYGSKFGNQFGDAIASIQAEIWSKKLNKTEALRLQMNQLVSLAGGEASPENIAETLEDNFPDLTVGEGNAKTLNPAHQEILGKIANEISNSKTVDKDGKPRAHNDASMEQVIRKMDKLFHQLPAEGRFGRRHGVVADVQMTMRQKRMRIQEKMGRRGMTDEDMIIDLKQKMGGYWSGYKQATNPKKKAENLAKLIELQDDATVLGHPMPPDIMMVLQNKAGVEKTLEALDDKGRLAGLRDKLVLPSIPTPTVKVEGGGGGPGTDFRVESQNLLDDITKSGNIGVPGENGQPQFGEPMSGEKDVMTHRYLAREEVGTGSLFDRPIAEKTGLFEQRMTDRQQAEAEFVGARGTPAFQTPSAEIQRMKVGEAGLFQQMPVGQEGLFKTAMPVEQEVSSRAFQDIKGLVPQAQDVLGYKEFLSERGAGKGALSGIVYRPTAGIVGASQIPGGSRWFDFPGAEEKRTKLDLGIKKEEGRERPPLSLLGVTSRLGGGMSATNLGRFSNEYTSVQVHSQPSNGDSRHHGAPFPKTYSTEYGHSQHHAVDDNPYHTNDINSVQGPMPNPDGDSSNVNMESLVGNPIGGGPKRKQTEPNIRKLNLFGKLPRF